MTDTLIVYGARCVWWDDISKTATLPTKDDKLLGSGIPCCPHCRGVLFQMEPEKWFGGLDRYEAEGHPGYRAMWEWMRGRCFPNLEAAEVAHILYLGRSS